MTRDELNDLARDVYRSDRWASAMAADLSNAGRQTAPATVNHWQSGERPVPGWLPDALVTALHGRAHRLRQAASRATAAATELSLKLAPDPEPDQELAPRM